MQFIVDEYSLEYSEEEKRYYISFKDSIGKNCRIEINKIIFEEYVESKKAYTKIRNEEYRHLDPEIETEEEIYHKSFEKNKSVEDEVLKNITITELTMAKKELTETQLRRLEMHYIDKITIREIARLENVRKKQIEKSIQLGLKKIKKFFAK